MKKKFYHYKKAAFSLTAGLIFLLGPMVSVYQAFTKPPYVRWIDESTKHAPPLPPTNPTIEIEENDCLSAAGMCFEAASEEWLEIWEHILGQEKGSATVF
jgi:hypothetical protein